MNTSMDMNVDNNEHDKFDKNTHTNMKSGGNLKARKERKKIQIIDMNFFLSFLKFEKKKSISLK